MLTEWLPASLTDNGNYRHRRIDEKPEARDAGLRALQELVERAHDDARAHLATLAGISLDPFDGPNSIRAFSYPDDLHTTTLQGYLGEILAGIVAENYASHERQWEVPAFLFRFHSAAFQALERRRQLGGAATSIPGRTGDDCVAFVREPDGRIVEWLMCEAKCSLGHDSHLISKGHEQLSLEFRAPVDLLQLIEILEGSADPDATDWVDALRSLFQEASGRDGAQRLDLFMYVCGDSPKNSDAWLPTTAPHAKYTRSGPLEAVELHFESVEDVLRFVYPNHMAAG